MESVGLESGLQIPQNIDYHDALIPAHQQESLQQLRTPVAQRGLPLVLITGFPRRRDGWAGFIGLAVVSLSTTLALLQSSYQFMEWL
jgi:hypothetical protein